MLNYYLKKSHLNNLTDKYFAQVSDVTIHDMESILALMSEKEVLVNLDEARLVLNTFYKVMETIITQGDGVNTNIFKAIPSISGVFDSADSPFNHGTHAVQMNLNLSKSLSALLPNVKVHKTDVKDNKPLMTEVYDSDTESVNANITEGGTIKIIGNRLKIAGTDAKVGFFFVKSDGTALKLRQPMTINEPSLLVLIVQKGALTVGDKVTLKIVTQYSGSTSLLKTPRTGLFTTVLTVV